MVLSLLKNIIPKASAQKSKSTVESKPVKKEEPVKREGFIQRSPYKGALYGAMFGVGAGIGDGCVTSLSIKRDLKKALEEFKTYSFANKRKAVEDLHRSGINVRQYKKIISGVQNTSTAKIMLKRGLLYGSIVAATGAAIDIYRNHKVKST